MSRRSLTLLQMRRTRSELGSAFRTFSPSMPEISAKTSDTVATMLPRDAEVLLASADVSPNPPPPVERLACTLWRGYSINWFAGHPSSKNDNSYAASGRSSGRLSIYVALVSSLWHADGDRVPGPSHAQCTRSATPVSSYQVGRTFVRHTWQQTREMLRSRARSPISNYLNGAIHLYPTPLRDADADAP